MFYKNYLGFAQKVFLFFIFFFLDTSASSAQGKKKQSRQGVSSVLAKPTAPLPMYT
jgi:hypothetical protein